jgi:hypothetical protein
MVRFVGAHVWLYVNGSFVSGIRDTSHTTGRIGVVCASSSAAVEIDNARIYTLASNWEPS